MQIVSIDFELRYDLALNEKCKPFTICTDTYKPQPIIGIPVNTAQPQIDGNSFEGGVLTVIYNGTWTGTMPMTFTYQWQRNGIAIVGETAISYTIVNADLGQIINCLVTATNIAGLGSAISSGLIPI
jgi:hypothetical protein